MAITPETRDYRTFEERALPEDGGDGQRQCRVEGYAAVFDQETVLYEYDGIEYKEIIARGDCYTLSQLAINGSDLRELGYEGRRIGELLEYALAEVLKDPALNEKERLLVLLREKE